MTKRMLIDASHAEETRVVVLDGTRLEDFDVETSTKRQLKGNIYLAKVVRVEPSLQAAFVEYGGNRHGFLAFSEIHPDYYQIPVADRQRLIEMQAEDARREEEEDDLELALSQGVEGPEATLLAAGPKDVPVAVGPKDAPLAAGPGVAPLAAGPGDPPFAQAPEAEAWALASTPRLIAADPVAAVEPELAGVEAEAWANPDLPRLVIHAPVSEQLKREETGTESPANEARAVDAPAAMSVERASIGHPSVTHPSGAQPLAIEAERIVEDDANSDDNEHGYSTGDQIEALPPPETVGGGDQESGDDQRERRMPPRFLRNYKIQEVIRRRQILLVQVVKEERGTKGAALTTYLSLAGRFGVLMPNSPRGGGISRKITSATDRRRLKEVMAELDIPRGMGMIVRTAGANRPKPEIKRDCEYLLRLWDDIREHTMKSVAPALIYEEASLIKRAIRDVYSRDIDEILVDGEEGWRAAHDFMRMLMPSHAKKVQLWRDGGQPLFARNQVEAQLDSMLMPTVQLRSGGYLVINQAEALVAIDVNSGRSTRERNIEETALRTNLEAADEVARQLRLRDLAGLIVIDFIDMESKRHNAMVERRIKEALKNDRARIQVGHISHFGLLEMSRQRLRPSLAETSFILCPHCGGTGHVRSTENAAIHVLRGVEDEGSKRRSAEIVVYVSTPVALYLLNHKRERIQEIELRYTMRVIVAADDAQIAPQFRIEKIRTRSPDEIPPVVPIERSISPPVVVEAEDEEAEAEGLGLEEDDNDTGEETSEQRAADAPLGGEEAAGDEANGDEASGDEASGGDDAGGDEAERRRKRRRRRRRGGRRDEPQPVATDGPSGEANAGGEAAEDSAVSNEPVVTDAVAASVGEDAAVSMSVAETGAASAGAAEALETNESGGEELPDTGETTSASDDDPRNRRRGRRGGRRRRRENEGELSPFAVPGADQPELQPVYAGPTPADPFGGRAFDIFDVMDQAERAAEAKPMPRASSAAEIVNNTAPEPEAPDPTLPVSNASIETRSAETEAPSAGTEAVLATAGDDLAPPSDAGEPDPEIPEATQPEAAASNAIGSQVAGSERLEGEIVNATAAEPAPEPLERQSANIADAPPEPANDTAPEIEPVPAEPLVKPILIGAGGEPPAAPKRGWWRR